MNKKLITICLIVMLTLAVILCVSCKTDNDNTVEMLRSIQVALVKEYSKVELTVTTVLDDDLTLGAKYEMTKTNGMTEITYAVDRLNGFDGVTPPEEIYTRVQGTAMFNGSAIVSIDGQALDEYILLDVVDTHMSFRTSLFSNVKLTARSFSANVTKPAEFLQDDSFAGTDMTVSVTIVNGNLDEIKINYVLDGAQVEMNYDFTL